MRSIAASPGRQVLALAIAVTAVRLLAAGAIPLTEDEAYYRLWAQHLQFGYYDHPPMIAWWIRLGTAAAGDTALGVRLLPSLAAGLGTWLVGDLALRLGLDPRAGPRAALFYNATLTVGLGGMLAIPDAPGSLFWTLCLWSLARAQPSGRRPVWWLAAGAAAGLGALSKYSGLFLAPGVLLWLLASSAGRAELKRPWPWLAALAAAAIFAPNVWWNAGHGWLTFARQFGRVAPAGLHPGHLPEFLATQALLLNPFVAVLAARGVALAWRARGGGSALALPILTGAPFLAYLLLHSLHDRVQGHWPAPLFAGLAICAAAAVGAAPSRTARWALACGLGVAALGLLLMALPRPLIVGGVDPTRPLRGWPAFAGDVEQLRQAQGAAWVGTRSYGLAAQLNLQGTSSAPILQVAERRRYDGLPAARPDFARPGLVVDLDRRMRAADLRRCFSVVEPARSLVRGRGPRPVGYRAFRVSRPKRDVWVLGCPTQVRPGVWR